MKKPPRRKRNPAFTHVPTVAEVARALRAPTVAEVIAASPLPLDDSFEGFLIDDSDRDRDRD